MSCSSYATDDRTPFERALIQCIRSSTASYTAYRNWYAGDPLIKGYHMHIQKTDWECLGALYRISRRGSIIYRKWEGLHP